MDEPRGSACRGKNLTDPSPDPEKKGLAWPKYPRENENLWFSQRQCHDRVLRLPLRRFGIDRPRELIGRSRAKALEKAVTAPAWSNTNANRVHATRAMPGIGIPMPVLVDSAIHPATNVVDAQKSSTLTFWRGIRWGWELPHSEPRPWMPLIKPSTRCPSRFA